MSDPTSRVARRPPTTAHLHSLDYRAEAARLGRPPVPIIDGHTHINGGRAAAIYREVRALFGVTTTYTQTQLAQHEDVLAALGDSARFVAIPEYASPDGLHAHTRGFLDNLIAWHERGARMVKFWCGPRGRDYGRDLGDRTRLTLDTPWRRKVMDKAAELGMAFMAHIADPDTWFATKYADASFYGTKRSQYEPLERLAEEYQVPWLIAHMGGWPEDLGFIDRLLDAHPQFVLDTSACKWMVRELSKHPREELVRLLRKHRGRIVFGTDIVTMDAHLSDDDGPRGMGAQAESEDEAFDLYASRYYAFRRMFETDETGPSPIADPDLMMVDPERYDASSSPTLAGLGLPRDLLIDLYRSSAESTLERWYARSPA